MSGFAGAVPDIVMGKDPWEALKDNALGVAGVLTGAGALQGLGGAAGAADGAMDLGGGLRMAADGSISEASKGGLLSALKTGGEYLKPVGQAANAAGQAGLLGGQRQVIAPSPMTAPGVVGGNQILGQLAQGGGENMQQMQLAEQMRQRRRMGLMGGGYGSA